MRAVLTAAQLERWTAAGESETQEFKTRTSSGCLREGAQTLCAMLNTRGGRVLFGVNSDGRVIGQEASDRTVEKVSAEVRRIDPPASCDVERVPLDAPALEVIAVTVSRSHRRPHTFKSVAYKRVGNTTTELTRDEYNQIVFEANHGTQRWETEVATGWSIEDLDVSEIARTVDEAVRRGRLGEPGTRDPREMLRGLSLLIDGELSRAAVALFARPEGLPSRFPQCRVRLARFRGTDKTEFIDNRQAHGNAFAVLTAADQFLRTHLPVSGRIVSGLFERDDDPIYPPVALREALANAVCHRDYSIGGGSVGVAIYDDRLEITSSGELHFGLTVDDLYQPHESLPWNPLIADVFFKRGIIETWGRGTLKMAELTQQAGLPRRSSRRALERCSFASVPAATSRPCVSGATSPNASRTCCGSSPARGACRSTRSSKRSTRSVDAAASRPTSSSCGASAWSRTTGTDAGHVGSSRTIETAIDGRRVQLPFNSHYSPVPLRHSVGSSC